MNACRRCHDKEFPRHYLANISIIVSLAEFVVLNGEGLNIEPIEAVRLLECFQCAEHRQLVCVNWMRLQLIDVGQLLEVFKGIVAFFCWHAKNNDLEAAEEKYRIRKQHIGLVGIEDEYDAVFLLLSQ